MPSQTLARIFPIRCEKAGAVAGGGTFNSGRKAACPAQRERGRKAERNPPKKASKMARIAKKKTGFCHLVSRFPVDEGFLSRVVIRQESPSTEAGKEASRITSCADLRLDRRPLDARANDPRHIGKRLVGPTDEHDLQKTIRAYTI
jgi:hypothetical protein